jgi:DNA-binding MarR family transcriptional regulator
MSTTAPEFGGIDLGPVPEQDAGAAPRTALEQARPRLLYHLLKLSNLVGRPFFTHFADRYDLTLNDVRVLMSLSHVGQAASHELCDATGMHPMNVSRSVARLKRLGRVTDRADPDNRRRKLLTPTAEGWALYRKLAPHVSAISEFTLANLSEREVEFLSSLIAVLAERLESVDLNSPLLIDAEALSRELDEAEQAAATTPRGARAGASLGNDAATL